MRKALDVAPDLPEARNAMGVARMGRGDWDGAVEAFQEAAYMTNVDLARFLFWKGRGVGIFASGCCKRSRPSFFLLYDGARVRAQR